MTFLNSAFLFALAAVSVPLIIHFLSKRHIKTIEFSSLKFLEQMQKNRMKWLKIKELLLLLLRMLIIGLIVLAFARPTLEGFVGSSRGSSSVVIILDRSASMDTEGETGSLFEEAKRIAGRLINSLEPNDMVSIISFPEGQVEFPADPINPGNIIRDRLAEIDLSYQAGKAGEAFKAALEILSESSNINKELFLISDGQETVFEELPVEALEMGAWDDIHFFTITPRPIHQDNIGIIAINKPRQLLAPGENFAIEADLVNFGGGTIENVLVGVVVDGERKAQSTVSLSPGRSLMAEFAFKLDKPGHHSGYIEIDYDNYSLDNKRFFSLYIPERVNLLAVAQSNDDLRFIKLALDRPEAGQIDFSGVTIADILRRDLHNYDIVLLHDLKSLGPAREKAVENYIEGGGGLLVSLGKQSQSRYWNGFLQKNTGIKTGDISGEENEYIYWDNFDYGHPIFSVYSEEDDINKSAAIPKIKINYYRNLSGGNIIGSSSSGINLLSESEVKPIIVYSSGFDLESGELPAHAFFIPFLVRSIEYLGSSHDDLGFDGIIGQPFRWQYKSSILEEFSLVGPEGITEKLKTASASSGLYISGTKYGTPGICRLESDGILISPLAFNIDPSESENKKIENIGEILGADIIALPANSDLNAAVKEARFGRELWKEFLLLALLLLIVESILGMTSPATTQKK